MLVGRTDLDGKGRDRGIIGTRGRFDKRHFDDHLLPIWGTRVDPVRLFQDLKIRWRAPFDKEGQPTVGRKERFDRDFLGDGLTAEGDDTEPYSRGAGTRSLGTTRSPVGFKDRLSARRKPGRSDL